MQVKSNRIFRPGNQFLIVFLIFLGSFPPLTIDMYLPALPNIAANLDATDELASYTLSAFFMVYAGATLIWGPISDKYGRRRVLIIGCLIYIIVSIAIVLTSSIWQLLVFRCLQAVGCASASSMSLAIVKDVTRGPRMEKLVSVMQAAHILAPLTAPVIGGFLLYFMDWRGIFLLLAACGVLALCGAFFLSETGRPDKKVSIGNTFKQIKVVALNKSFGPRLLLFSWLAMPFFSFLSASSFIYQIQFALTAQQFSFFFAFNAVFSLGGPFCHLYIFSKLNRNKIIQLEILGTVLAGCAIIFLGALSPIVFALLMAPVTFLGSAMRPPSTVIMMESVKGNNGIVASLIQCGAMLCGSLAMWLATLTFWPSPTLAVGAIVTFSSLLGLIYWKIITARV